MTAANPDPTAGVPIRVFLLDDHEIVRRGIAEVLETAPDLTIVGELMATGKVTPVIDRRFSLSEVPEALRYLEEGHARGKVAITLEYSNET